MKTKTLKTLKKNKMILILIIALILINVYAIISLEKVQTKKIQTEKDQNLKYTLPESSEKYVCPIEYSKPKCINSNYFISFYNPNEFELHKIQIIAEKPDGTDTISVDSTLPKNRTEILRLPECYEIENVEVRWCCADICYQTPLTAYSENVTISP